MLHCHLKALVHHHMHCSDRTARERFSFGFALGDAPFFEQFYVELLHVPRENHRDFLIAEIRTDVCICVENILVQRLRAHHILLIAEPTVEPFVQVHEAIFVQFHPAIGIEELIKFRHCLALRLAEDRFIIGLPSSLCPTMIRASHLPSGLFLTIPSPFGRRLLMFFTFFHAQQYHKAFYISSGNRKSYRKVINSPTFVENFYY